MLPISLLSLITVILLAGFWLGPRVGKARPLFTCGNIVLLAFFANLLLATWLELTLGGGRLTYAQSLSNEATILNALSVCFASLCSFLLVYSLILESGRRPKSEHEARAPDPYVAEMQAPAVLLGTFIIAGLALKLYILSTLGLGPELITRLSGTARRAAVLAGREDASLANIASLSMAADAALAYMTAFRLRRSLRAAAPHIAALVLVLLLSYVILAKRSHIVMIALAPIVAYSMLRRPLTLRAAPALLALVLGGGMLTLFARIFLPAEATGSHVEMRGGAAGGSAILFYFYSLEFAGFDMLVRCIHNRDAIGDSLGGHARAFYVSTIEPFTYIIPRAIWPDKPSVYLDVSHALFADTFGGGVAPGTGLAATAVGNSYVMGGLFGAILAMACIGAVAALADRTLHRAHTPSARLALLYTVAIVLTFQLFRQGSLGWTFLTFVQLMAVPTLTWILLTQGTLKRRIVSSRRHRLPIKRRGYGKR